jgi:hypothetical protein
LVNCVCGENILAWSGRAKELEAELNRTCPAHGFRRVGRIHCFKFAVTETTPESEKERLGREDAELHQVIDEYKSRELVWRRQRSRRRQIPFRGPLATKLRPSPPAFFILLPTVNTLSQAPSRGPTFRLIAANPSPPQPTLARSVSTNQQRPRCRCQISLSRS